MIIISQANKKAGKKKKFRLDAKFWTRVLVILLTVGMLGGSIYYLFLFIFSNNRVYAADPPVEEETAEADDDPLIRIALIYGTSVTVDFLTVADYGFCLG